MTDTVSEIDKILATEGFEGDAKIKLAALFESTLADSVAVKHDELETIAEQYVSESIAEKTAELEEKLDKYLSYVAEEFITENEIAIESGRRVAAAEAILEGVAALMAEQSLSLDEDDSNVLDEMQEKVEKSKTDLDESIEKQIKLKSEINSLKRELVMKEATEGLSDVQAERLGTLMEDFDFDASDVESFIAKADTIKSTLSTTVITESDEIVETVALEEQPIVDDFMASIVSHLGKK